MRSRSGQEGEIQPPDSAAERVRRNPVTGTVTVIAPERRHRPGAGARAEGRAPTCPFCAGHEALTPPEIDAFRAADSAPDSPGWQVRVVPNKYPAIPGGHEVIVHSPDHERDLEELPPDAAAAVLRMYQRRIEYHLRAGARAVTIICNHGASAGASLDHPHSQVFALPLVPPQLLEEIRNVEHHRRHRDACLVCAEAEQAIAAGRQVFSDTLAAWVPLAPRWPFETWLAPSSHEADFRAADPAHVAAALQRLLVAVDRATGTAPRNFWLHTVPAGAHGAFHWHIEVAPRTSTAAGFELSTGMTIVDVQPEEAARRLRAALPPTRDQRR